MTEAHTQILHRMMVMLDDPISPEEACQLSYRAVHLLLNPDPNKAEVYGLLVEMSACASESDVEFVDDCDGPDRPFDDEDDL
jgi:hypothetical protein